MILKPCWPKLLKALAIILIVLVISRACLALQLLPEYQTSQSSMSSTPVTARVPDFSETEILVEDLPPLKSRFCIYIGFKVSFSEAVRTAILSVTCGCVLQMDEEELLSDISGVIDDDISSCGSFNLPSLANSCIAVSANR